MAEGQRKTEVIDLWSEDTKQDAWFTQSALDVGFRWLETAYPGFSVYLFFGKPNEQSNMNMKLVIMICTVEPRSTDTPLIRTPHYYGQFGIPRPKAHTFL